MKFDAKRLRELEEEKAERIRRKINRNPIYLILEDVYDTYNIGGIFRLADAIAAEKIYLCGETETPPNHKIKKASVGTYKIVPWEYRKTALDAIKDIKKELGKKGINPEVVAIEQNKDSVGYFTAKYNFPIVFILGNETLGVKKETLKLVDKIVEIPMYGVNKSLNVIVAGAIVMFDALRKM